MGASRITALRTPFPASASVAFSDGARAPDGSIVLVSVPSGLDAPVASIAVPEVLIKALPEPASAAPIASTTVLVVAVVMVCDGISIGSNDFKHLPRTNLVATMVAAAILFGTSTTGCGLCRVWMSMFAFFVVRFAQHLLHAVSHRRDSVLAKAMGMAA